MKHREATFRFHDGGKLEVQSRSPIRTREDLSYAYTPGVAHVCEAIHRDPEAAFRFTIKNNTIAVVTDGSAVLGIGDIGPTAALPVMEGKALLLKDFGGVNAFPLCLALSDPDEIVRTVIALAPVFGGILLEDISAPRCFEIEERLQEALPIPVFHDDQHGTAVVMLAGLINAATLLGRPLRHLKVVVSGVGAAGVACTKILLRAGVTQVIGCDRNGILFRGRAEGMTPVKQWYAEHTNPANQRGTISDALAGADVFIGLSGPGVISADDVRRMNAGPIVFALANPTPEVMPEDLRGIASIVATGRSDYPNQVNNVLAFPGIFKGALRCRARRINEEMKLAAAEAIAAAVPAHLLSPEQIVPSVFDRQLVDAVASAVEAAARATGVANEAVLAPV